MSLTKEERKARAAANIARIRAADNAIKDQIRAEYKAGWHATHATEPSELCELCTGQAVSPVAAVAKLLEGLGE
jgi:hypothetical protein